MTGGAGDGLSVRKGVLKFSGFLQSYNMLKTSRNRTLLPRSHRDKSDDEMWLAGGNYL